MISFDHDVPAGRRLRLLRVAKGLTLQQVSDALSIPISTLSAMERGTRRPIDSSTTRGLLKHYGAESMASEILCEGLTPIDFGRIRDWLRSSPRKPPELAFSAGPERDLAHEIEMAIQAAIKPAPE